MKYRIERAGTQGHYQPGWFVIFPEGRHGRASVRVSSWRIALSTVNRFIEMDAR